MKNEPFTLHTFGFGDDVRILFSNYFLARSCINERSCKFKRWQLLFY